jgi:serine protease Do
MGPDVLGLDDHGGHQDMRSRISSVRSRLFYVALGATAALVFVAGSFSLGRLSAQGSPTVVFPHPAFAQAQTVDGKTVSVSDIAERTMASVVNVSSVRKVRQSPIIMDPFFRDFFRQFGPADPSPRLDRGLGSGVIVSADGLVITNNHVIAEAEKIRVLLPGKREVDAKVIGTDPKSDVAVLRLQGVKGLRPIPLGDSDKARLGDLVLAIGNPFGVGQTVTMGIVSAKGRANMGIVDYEDFIQTDAAINPGNSGGALVNMRGELIGLNTAILSRTGGYQGIGFAIPTNMVRPIMASLVRHGRVVRGWLGVVIQDVDAELARAMKLPTRAGVLISDVTPGGPAARAGMKRGDLVVKLNGHDVDSAGKLRNLVAAAGVGSRAKVEYYRGGRLESASVPLGELPANIAAASGGGGSGLSVVPLNPAARNKFNIPAKVNTGVVIEAVQPQSAAAAAGLQAGDVILEVNRVTITSVGRFSQMLAAARGQVLLLVYRRGGTLYTILNK